MKKKIILYTATTVLLMFFMIGINVICSPNIAHAEQEWLQEYAAICGETQYAMTLSIAELKDYIERCEKLRERIHELQEQQGNTKRKVYEKRLKMCRDLYVFTLEYKER